MTSFTIALSVSLLALSVQAACSSSHGSDAEEPSPDKGYGYEFEADSVNASPSTPLAQGTQFAEGRLRPEAIQAVVRLGMPAVKSCYSDALKRSPGLTGKLDVRFVIGRDGHVASVQNGSATVGDAALSRCVFGAFQSLAFPKLPSDEIITVVYPVMLAP